MQPFWVRNLDLSLCRRHGVLMFPIRDHNPSGRTPYVTYALIVLNVIVYMLRVPELSEPQVINAHYREWGMIPAHITAGRDYITLVSSMFLHGGFMHIAGNTLFLWIFGDNMEDEMGHFKFLVFYIATGIAASFVHILSAPGSLVPTVGASGAIAGVMGGYLLLFPKARVDILLILIIIFRIIPVPSWIMLGLWFGMQIFGGVGSTGAGGGVAYWAHAGGFVAGILATIPLFLRLGATQFWQRTDGHPPHPDANYAYIKSRIPKVGRK